MMAEPAARILVAAAVGAVACGGPTVAPVSALPERAPTPGDVLLGLLPAGADAVAEVDVARVRDSASVGEVVGALRKRAASGFDPVGAIDVAVAAVYRLGASDAATLFVLRGPAVSTLPESVRAQSELLDDRTLLVGPTEERDRARSGGPTLAGDARFLALRAQAMPAKASGAVLRVTARLDPQARVAAAGRTGLDEMPATLSAWLDVADDVALIAVLGGDDEADAVRLAGQVSAAAARARRILPDWLPHGKGGGELTTRTAGRLARVVWLLGPRHLAAWARETARRLEKTGT